MGKMSGFLALQVLGDDGVVNYIQDGDMALSDGQQLLVAEQYQINDTDTLTLDGTSMLVVING